MKCNVSAHTQTNMQTHKWRRTHSAPSAIRRVKRTDRQTNKQSVLLVEEQFPTKNLNEERGSSQWWTLINRTALEEFSLLIVSQHALHRPELPDFLQRRAD